MPTPPAKPVCSSCGYGSATKPATPIAVPASAAPTAGAQLQFGYQQPTAGGTPGKRLRAIDGSVPLLGALPPGCAFNPRCPDRFHLCTSAPPPEYVVGSEHAARCYLHDEALGPAKAGHSVHDK